MRILLTGGMGFVGRAVIQQLLCKEVTLGLILRQHTAECFQYPATIFTLGLEAWTEDSIVDVIEKFAPDAIAHLAGGARNSSIDKIYEANTFLGERLMAAAARAAPTAQILILGSAAEYGVPIGPTGLCREHDACQPITAYGIAKFAQTLHAQTRASYGQPIIIARLFNPVGPAMPQGLAFQDFAQRLAARPELVQTGDIDIARDFIDVKEAARVLVELLTCQQAIGQIVNVCSGVAQPLRNGIERLISRLQYPVKLIEYIRSFPPSKVRLVRGDTGKLEAFGIRPPSADINGPLDSLMDEALLLQEERLTKFMQ